MKPRKPGARPALRRGRTHWLVAAFVLGGAAICCWPQALGAADSVDAQTVKQLMSRIDDLQKRVSELEAQKAGAANTPSQTASGQTAPAPPPPPPSPEPSADAGGHTMTVPGGLQMRIQGFAHTGFTDSDEKGATSSFFLGNFDLFITSQLSEQFRVLSELTFEPGEDSNDMGVDLERMQLLYTPNEHLQWSFGRSHTNIGYYNTAFHHGNWFETATDRPLLFRFEDDGGPLPTHNVGLSATGLIYGGKLGLHYVADFGNGRPARHAEFSTVQNSFDENNGKDFNLGLYVRPDWLRGLQAGISVYHDHLTPDVLPRIDEIIPIVHVVYITPKFEFLNEGVLIRHAFDQSHRVLNESGFYTLISREWHTLRPYFRYQYINTSALDPVIGDLGRQDGPSLGLRYDWTEYAAFKIQYDRTERRGLDPVNGATALMAFTF